MQLGQLYKLIQGFKSERFIPEILEPQLSLFLKVQVLKSHFEEKKFISKEDDFKRILFNHFTNKNMINFLFGLTSSFEPLDFEKLTDLNVSPDQMEKPPKELRELLDGINNLKIQGKELQSHNSKI